MVDESSAVGYVNIQGEHEEVWLVKTYLAPHLIINANQESGTIYTLCQLTDTDRSGHTCLNNHGKLGECSAVL